MDALQHGRVSVAEFLSWVSDQDRRYELASGQVVMMAGASVGHNVVVNNITVALTPLAKKNGCRSLTNDMAVQTGPNTIRYPDVVIDCGPPNPQAMSAARPTIIVEVSSPSTAQVDATLKLDEYKNIPSVELVIQVEPEKLLVGVFRRVAGETWQTETYEALEDRIDLPAIGGVLTLADIYDTLDVHPRPCVQIVSSNTAKS